MYCKATIKIKGAKIKNITFNFELDQFMRKIAIHGVSVCLVLFQQYDTRATFQLWLFILQKKNPTIFEGRNIYLNCLLIFFKN